MKIIQTRNIILATAIALAITGCGGGKSNTVTGTGTGTAAQTSVSAKGRISGFGSVLVNGTKYDVSSSTIDRVNLGGNQAMAETDLKVGMIVNVQGTKNGTTGVASSITYDETLDLPITNITLKSDGTGVIVASGQTINVGSTTVFYGDLTRLTIQELKAGDMIEVSGYTGTNGTIEATLISYESVSENANHVELEGVISNLDTIAKTFTINGLKVNYATASQLNSSVALANGTLIEAEGTFNSTRTVLNAAFIKAENSSNDLVSNTGDTNDSKHDYELQGIISNVKTGQFSLAGITVKHNNSTKFKGLTSAKLVNGLYLEEVEGHYNAQKAFIATQIEVEGLRVNGSLEAAEMQKELKIGAHVAAVNTTAKTVTILGYTATMDTSTIVKDDDDSQDRYFNFSSLRVGDYVEATLFLNSNQTYSIEKLERERAKVESSLEGVVTKVNVDGSVLVGATKVFLPQGSVAVVGRDIHVYGSNDATTKVFTATRIKFDD